MKLSRRSIAVIFVIIIGLISFGIYMLFPQRSYTYSKMKVDISILRALKGNFKSLSFQSVTQSVGGVNKIILSPVITVVSGNPGNYSGVIKAERNDTILNFSATPYPSRYDVSLVQIDSLLAIPEVAYFIVVANKYPPNPNMVAFTIRPYNAGGGLIIMNRAYLRLNPCPPALAYQSSDPN
jgi:hypothetical protein